MLTFSDGLNKKYLKIAYVDEESSRIKAKLLTQKVFGFLYIKQGSLAGGEFPLVKNNKGSKWGIKNYLQAGVSKTGVGFKTAIGPQLDILVYAIFDPNLC